MTIPSNLTDCDALLDNYSEMNRIYPVSGEAANGDFYLTTINWESLSKISDRETYKWDVNTDITYSEWQAPYKAILLANQVLKVLENIDQSVEVERYGRIKGSAFFYRAYAMSQLASVITLPYDKDKASETLGLPVRISPDVDVISKRANLKETYDQVISDLNEAIVLLPRISALKVVLPRCRHMLFWHV